jgi:ribosome maturation factor RimP
MVVYPALHGADAAQRADKWRDEAGRTVSRSTSNLGRLEGLLGLIVEQFGCDLEHVELSPSGRRRQLRILVDRDGGVTLDDLAEVTRAVSKALDSSDDVMGELIGDASYTMEISSPGVDRPLTQPRHWRRNIGRLVTVRLTGGGSVKGRIADAGDEDAGLIVEGKERRIGYDEVQKAKVQVEFNRKGGDEPEKEA